MSKFDDIDRQKIAAAGKMAFGVFRMASAVGLATGHGLLGRNMAKHHMTGASRQLAKKSFLGGKRMFEEGLEQWRSGGEPPSPPAPSAKPVA